MEYSGAFGSSLGVHLMSVASACNVEVDVQLDKNTMQKRTTTGMVLWIDRLHRVLVFDALQKVSRCDRCLN